VELIWAVVSAIPWNYYSRSAKRGGFYSKQKMDRFEKKKGGAPRITKNCDCVTIDPMSCVSYCTTVPLSQTTLVLALVTLMIFVPCRKLGVN
jgi:hypothetical protein